MGALSPSSTDLAAPQLSDTSNQLTKVSSDYHAVANQLPVMMGAMVACTKVTHANGGTRIIPGSQNWTIDKIPRQADATTIELNPGDCVMFLGNVFHGGGENTTK